MCRRRVWRHVGEASVVRLSYSSAFVRADRIAHREVRFTGVLVDVGHSLWGLAWAEFVALVLAPITLLPVVDLQQTTFSTALVEPARHRWLLAS